LISQKRLATALDLNREDTDSSDNIPPSPKSKSPSSRFKKSRNLTPKFTDFDPDFSPSDTSSFDTLHKAVSKRMRIESVPKRLNVSDDEDDAAEHERVEVERFSPGKRGKKRKQRLGRGIVGGSRKGNKMESYSFLEPAVTLNTNLHCINETKH